MSDVERTRFEALFTQHYAAVVRYAVRRVGRESAEEIVAETFLVAWRRLDQVPDIALPWLYGTARRLVANELRRRARARRLGERVEANGSVTADDPGELVPQQLYLQAALAALSERDREVLRLAEWEQLTPAEGALVMGCTTAAFKVRLHRARRRFRQVVTLDPAPQHLTAAPVTRGEIA